MARATRRRIDLPKARMDAVWTKGVLGKDRQPYVPATAWVTDTRGFQRPIPYTPMAVLAALAQESTAQVEVIDEANDLLRICLRQVDTTDLEARTARTLSKA